MYTEVQQVFIKSNEGITPLQRNAYVAPEGLRRFWSVYQQLLGVDKRTLMKTASRYYTSGENPWQKDGKSVMAGDLLQWVKTGIREAMTVEELLTQNPDAQILLEVIFHPTQTANSFVEGEMVCKKDIKSSEDLDFCIKEYRAKQSEKGDFEILFKISKDYLKTRKCNLADKVVLVSRRTYYRRHNPDKKEVEWTRDPLDAAILSRNEAIDVCVWLKNLFGRNYSTKIESADFLDFPYNAVIKSLGSNWYISKYGSTNFPHFTTNIEYARRYPTEEAALKEIERLRTICPNNEFVVEILPEKEKEESPYDI